MSAVYHDLQVLHFRVSFEALCLSDKYVTGPLWGTMIKKKEVWNMSNHYSKMYNHGFLDATPFLDGENSLSPNLVQKDDRLVLIKG